MLPTGGTPPPATLLATLPPAEAVRRAAEVHPGLRAAPPEGGVLRECLRRHGLVPGWIDLPTRFPTSCRADGGRVRKAEAAVLAALKAGHAHAPYKVGGSPRPAGRARLGPARIADPAAVLSRLLKAWVEVAGAVRRDPGRDFADPRTWGLDDPRPADVVPLMSACSRCDDPTPPGVAVCAGCARLDERAPEPTTGARPSTDPPVAA